MKNLSKIAKVNICEHLWGWVAVHPCHLWNPWLSPPSVQDRTNRPLPAVLMKSDTKVIQNCYTNGGCVSLPPKPIRSPSKDRRFNGFPFQPITLQLFNPSEKCSATSLKPATRPSATLEEGQGAGISLRVIFSGSSSIVPARGTDQLSGVDGNIPFRGGEFLFCRQ